MPNDGICLLFSLKKKCEILYNYLCILFIIQLWCNNSPVSLSCYHQYMGIRRTIYLDINDSLASAKRASKPNANNSFRVMQIMYWPITNNQTQTQIYNCIMFYSKLYLICSPSLDLEYGGGLWWWGWQTVIDVLINHVTWLIDFVVAKM